MSLPLFNIEIRMSRSRNGKSDTFGYFYAAEGDPLVKGGPLARGDVALPAMVAESQCDLLPFG